MLLASAASYGLAAPAPVSELGNTTSARRATSTNSDLERLERLFENRSLAQLQTQQQVDEMSSEIKELRGQLEKSQYEMQQMLQRQRDLFVEVDRLRSELKNQNLVVTATPNTTESEAKGTFSSDMDEQTAYQHAVDLILKQRDYASAITAFQQFQQNYPNSAFIPNTHYWLGQIYFAKKQDKEAVQSFAAVLAYPDSNKHPDALVKLGDLAKRNNNMAQAKKYYQQVIAKYPESASAKYAQEQLK